MFEKYEGYKTGKLKLKKPEQLQVRRGVAARWEASAFAHWACVSLGCGRTRELKGFVSWLACITEDENCSGRRLSMSFHWMDGGAATGQSVSALVCAKACSSFPGHSHLPPAGLCSRQEVLDITRLLVLEQGAHEDSEAEEQKCKLEQLKTVLEM